jgi:hypothetical protein
MRIVRDYEDFSAKVKPNISIFGITSLYFLRIRYKFY